MEAVDQTSRTNFWQKWKYEWNERSVVRALRPRNTPPDWKLPEKPEMEPLKGERIVFYTSLYKKAEEQATQCWPGL